MTNVKNPTFSMLTVLSTVFVLAAMGCGGSSGGGPNGPGVQPKSLVNPLDQDYTKLTATEIERECSNSEFSKLIAWKKQVDVANEAIDKSAGKKSKAASDLAKKAVQACYETLDRHDGQACRKTKTTILATEVKYYDQARIKEICAKSSKYLVKNNERPEPITDDEAPTEPGLPPVLTPAPEQPPVLNPVQPNPAPEPFEPAPEQSSGTSGQYRQCTATEFQNLSAWSAAQTKADNAVKSLGAQANWKYDSNAISSAAIATKTCESLIKTHAQSPCEKSVKEVSGATTVKQYTADSLRQRCQTVRTYFYEYVQNSKTLIFPNADLILNLSYFSQKVFPSNYVNLIQGCRVENPTAQTIDYSSGVALVRDTRGFDEKMMVLQTAEGLLVQCYGLNIDGPFSKDQLMKVLKEEDSDIRLYYKLK